VVVLSAADCRFGYRDSVFKSIAPERWVVLAVSFRLVSGGAPRLAYPELVRELERQHIDAPALADVRRAVLDLRRSKSMVIDAADENRRSCGSFFVNPVVLPDVAENVARAAGDADLPRFAQPDGRLKLSAAWLIERAGFARGSRAGCVGLSTRHTLALVCQRGARAGDVVAFARRIRAGVERRFGIRLVPEPVFWGFTSLDDGLPDERLA
jgi:UDP-N-acetylmuramate dehydrogenase